MASSMAPIATSNGPNGRSPPVSLTDLPSELHRAIFDLQSLAIDRISFAMAWAHTSCGPRGFTILVESLPVEFFTNTKIRDALFGSAGIKGHNAKYPRLQPSLQDPLNDNGWANTFSQLTHLARQQDNKAALEKLYERRRIESVTCLGKAVFQSRRMRQDTIKPTRARKRNLGFDRLDSRTYTELLATVEENSMPYKDIMDAKAEQEGEQLVDGKNLDVLQKFFTTLFEDDAGIGRVCGGCFKPDASFDAIGQTCLPFCRVCFNIHRLEVLKEVPFLKTLKAYDPALFDEVVSHQTLWYKPLAVPDPLSTNVKYYFERDQEALLQSIICTRMYTAEALTPPHSLTHEQVAEIAERFKCINDAMHEIALQYFRKGTSSLGNPRSLHQTAVDLSAAGLPEWFMLLVKKKFDMGVKTTQCAQDVANFVADWHDAYPKFVVYNQPLWRQHVIAAFWQERTLELLDDEDWQDMYKVLSIISVKSWTDWQTSDSKLHSSFHHIDRMTAYCDIIHGSSPADVLKMDAIAAQQNLAAFKTFAAATESILRLYSERAVATVMRVVVIANGSENTFDHFIRIISRWWDTYSSHAAIDADSSDWLDPAALAFWKDVVHLYFPSDTGRLPLIAALHLNGINSTNPIREELLRTTKETFGMLPDILKALVVEGILLLK